MILLGIDTSSAIGVAVLEVGEQCTTLARRSVYDPRHHAELLMPFVAEALAEAELGRGDVDGVVVGLGPGPFTGLRVGIVTARTLGFALNRPVFGVCGLDALAAEAAARGELSDEGIVAIDARRREVYWAQYRLITAPAAVELGVSAEPGASATSFTVNGLPFRPVERVGDVVVGPPSSVPRRPKDGTVDSVAVGPSPADGGHLSGAAADAHLPVVGRACELYPAQLGEPGTVLDPDPTWAIACVAARVGLHRLPAAPGDAAADLEPLYLRRPDVHAGGPRKRVS